MNRTKHPRRKFLKLAATGAASAAAVACGARRPWSYLSADESGTLIAICELVIPTDQDAGATGAGVVRYIDRQLVGPYRRFKKVYRQGLIAIDRFSAARFSKRFAELDASRATELLHDVESGKMPSDIWNPGQARSFFNMVVAHTMQGFYGDPRHGGNADEVSWRMIGVPLIPIRGRFTNKRTS